MSNDRPQEVMQFVKKISRDMFPPDEDGWEVTGAHRAFNQVVILVHICRAHGNELCDAVVPVDWREIQSEQHWPSIRRRVQNAITRIQNFYKETDK